MNDKNTNPIIEPTNIEPTQQPAETTPVPIDEKKAPKLGFIKSKKALVAVLAILMMGGAGAVFYLNGQNNEPAPAVATVTKKTQLPTKATSQPLFYYYNKYTLTSSPKRQEGAFKYDFAFLNPKDQTIKKETLTTPWDFTLNSSSSNSSFQFSKDGKRYVYGVSDHGGADDPYVSKANSFMLNIGTWGNEPKNIIKDKEYEEFVDWKLTADGKELIYIDQPKRTDKTPKSTDLYSVDFDSGIITKIGAVNRPVDRENSRLFEVQGDKSVRFYTSAADGIYETKYDRQAKKITTKKVVDKSKYDFGSMGPLSPDGTKLLYSASNSKLAGVIVSVLDLKTGEATQLLKNPDTKVGYSLGEWSPDGKSILFNTGPYGAGAQEQKGFKNQVFIMKLDTKETKTLTENSSPGTYIANYATWYQANSWSEDGNYITYLQNKKLYFYDLQAAKVLDKLTSDIGDAIFISSTYGWLQK
jgi:hypothetical protein